MVANDEIESTATSKRLHSGTATDSVTAEHSVTAKHIATVGGFFLAAIMACGCSTTAKLYVWQSPPVELPPAAKIAVAPVAGDPILASYVEQALLAQRPPTWSGIALYTPEQLAAASPIRLASTAPINHDATALLAARAAGANVLLHGEIARTDLTLDDLQPQDGQEPAAKSNMNGVGLQRLLTGRADPDRRSLLLTWRCLDVESGKLLGAHSFNIDSQQAAADYPDLEVSDPSVGTRLVAAAARETWQVIAPSVTKSNVRLAVPVLQPGSFWVRRGNRAAKKGDWALAEQRWQATSKWFWFNAPAKHNLAIAQAAREDFEAAKQSLAKTRGPLGFRLPSETLFWLDQHHRAYNAAHGLGEPADGWAIPHATEVQVAPRAAPPVDIDQLPWWTAIPFAKPPGWTWQQYFAHISIW